MRGSRAHGHAIGSPGPERWAAVDQGDGAASPYAETIPKKAYQRELHDLQVELVKLQKWVVEQGERIVIVFEGRDAAGKGGAIRRFSEYLNPRQARIAALPKPNDTERTQWYFQRYVSHLPAAGEIVLFDRSWYNRAGVEHVMGFCTRDEYEEFFRQVPTFERNLVRSGITLFKLWFTVSKDEQRSASTTARPIRCGSGSSRRWTSRRSAASTSTARPATRCCDRPTTRCRGR